MRRQAARHCGPFLLYLKANVMACRRARSRGQVAVAFTPFERWPAGDGQTSPGLVPKDLACLSQRIRASFREAAAGGI